MEAYVCRLVSEIFGVFLWQLVAKCSGLRPFALFVCVDVLPPNQQFKSCFDEFLSSIITKQLIKHLAQVTTQ